MRNTSARPEKLSWFVGCAGVLLFCAGIFLAQTANTHAAVPACAGAATVILLALAAAGRTRLGRKHAQEELAFEEFRRQHGHSELFDDADEAVRMAARTAEHYVKYFVPFFTIVVGLAIVITGVVLWRSWSGLDQTLPAENPLPMATLAIGLFIIALIAGSYFVGVSREPGCRWVRPAGAWLLGTGALFLLVGIVLIAENVTEGVSLLDLRVARISLFVLIVLGAELVLSFVIEFYRPRMPGEEERPLPESRLLALFTEPGGIARNVAASLDYQFGFKVSEAWFYRFLERTVVPFAVITVLLLWLQTIVVVIQTEERGIYERFGHVVRTEPLEPGFHLKLPTPFARIRTFPVDKVQVIVIGYEGKDDAETEEKDEEKDDGHGHDHGEEEDPEETLDDLAHNHEVIVWSQAHADDEPVYIVPSESHEEGPTDGDDAEAAIAAPVTVQMLAASVPVYFKVKDLYQYQYGHQPTAEAALHRIAGRELTRYLASVDFMEVLTHGRERGAATLTARIQEAADDHELGVEVVFVGLQGLHPPVEVGKAFDQVVAASEESHEKVLLAEAEANRTVPDAEAERLRLLSEAESYQDERSRVAKAESERFKSQLEGFKASPKLFVLNSFLDILENDAVDIRRYIVACPGSQETVIINLEKKLRPDLMDFGSSSETE